MRYCKYCNKRIKKLNSNSQIYHRECFKKHRKDYNKLFGQKPERIKQIREYNQRPETKARKREYEKTEPVKAMRRRYKPDKTRVKARVASRVIKIPKGQKCQFCNKEMAIEKHHEDYSKPLEVIFTCKPCHHKLMRIEL